MGAPRPVRSLRSSRSPASGRSTLDTPVPQYSALYRWRGEAGAKSERARPPGPETIRAARAEARSPAWDASACPDTITFNIDATLLDAYSEKERAAGNYKGGFGFFLLLCNCGETDEALTGILRPGNAGANTAADHFCVLQMAPEQLPETDLHREICVRADVSGATHDFTADCGEASIRFSVS
jgi:Transposase DDE domain group 1